METERLAYLVKKWQEGNCTPEETKELDAWLWEDNGSVSDEVVKSIGKDMYREFREHFPLAKEPQEDTAPVRKLFPWRYAAAAAILVIVATAGWHFLSVNKQEIPAIVAHDALPGHNGAILTLSDGRQVVLDSGGNGQIGKQGTTTILKQNGQLVYNTQKVTDASLSFNTLSTPKARQYSVVLPDGSHVWLNAASSLKYPTAFNGKQREVEMTGEAYFEVAHNASQPFIIKTNGTEVKVLGTHFNINAYSDESTTRTTLLQGLVEVSYGGKDLKIQPGKQARSEPQGIRVLSVNTEQVVAWKNGLFDFNGMTLKEVLRQLARWYDMHVVFEGGNTDELFSGEIDRNLNLSQVLSGLESMHLHFRIEGKKLIVKQ